MPIAPVDYKDQDVVSGTTSARPDRGWLTIARVRRSMTAALGCVGRVSPVEYDRNGLEVLSRDESLRHLMTIKVGRVAISADALPVILPVSFAVLDGDIVFATATGTKLATASTRQVLAFEADELDRGSRTGWSVCVTGVAEMVTAPHECEQIEVALEPVIPIDQPRFLRIRTDVISGRRVPPPTPDRGGGGSPLSSHG